MNKHATKNGVSVRAYKGDAMTLLAFDLTAGLTKNLVGFSISYKYKVNNVFQENYIFNRMKFPNTFFDNNVVPFEERNSTLWSPIQKLNWVHVPNTNINTQLPVFGDYTYSITPRYMVNGKLEPLKATLTVKVKINVSPFDMKKTKVGFTRGFVSSTAYAKRFNVKNNSVRPKGAANELLFDITQKADTAKRWNDTTKKYEDIDYTYEEQHQWLGWQARQRIIDFLDEVINDNALSIKAFAYDLDEPEICKRLIILASQNRITVILDNDGKHGTPASMETTFENKFKAATANANDIQRGNFLALAHSKVFIQIKNNKAVKVLTGSTNFSTNGLYINSNHVLIFDNKKIAQQYSDVFDASFTDANMSTFKGGQFSINDFPFTEATAPSLTVTFAPHTKDAAQRIFDRISKRILKAGNTDVLFAIMKDTSASSILDAVKQQVQSETVFTYGITDSISDNADYEVFLYKPNSLRGIRVAAKGIQNVLPKPFGTVAKVDGYAIHHKFVVVNFKGDDPTVYCGSSNLSFTPEQKNGDNLLEIHDTDIVTAFAIQALALVDHFHWRNTEMTETELNLDDNSNPAKAWWLPWFDSSDLKNRQRKLYIKE